MTTDQAAYAVALFGGLAVVGFALALRYHGLWKAAEARHAATFAAAAGAVKEMNARLRACAERVGLIDPDWLDADGWGEEFGRDSDPTAGLWVDHGGEC